MWQVSCNCKRDNTDTKYLMTLQSMLECEKDTKFTPSKENSKREWEDITDL